MTKPKPPTSLITPEAGVSLFKFKMFRFFDKLFEKKPKPVKVTLETATRVRVKSIQFSIAYGMSQEHTNDVFRIVDKKMYHVKIDHHFGSKWDNTYFDLEYFELLF